MQSKKPKRFTSQNYLKYYYDIPHEGKTSAGRALRRLKNITCPYRGIKIISTDNIKGFEKNLARCKTASDAVELLAPYQKNMLPVEKSIYAIFKDFIRFNPDDNLQNCLQMIKMNCLMKLKLEEMEVLDDVDMLTRKLSPQTAIRIREKTTRCRQIILSNCNHDCFKRKIFLSSLEEIIPKELVETILNHKHKITNRKLIEEIFEYILNTELWKFKQCYCREDVRVAIVKCLINRLKIDQIK